MSVPKPLPFVRPGTYFREHGRGLPLVPAIVAVALVAVAVTASFAGIGWLFVTHLAEDATVENPDRPPEQFCEGTDPGDPFYDDCHPERVPMDEALWTAIEDQLPLVFGAVAVFCAGLTAVLYLLPPWLGDPAGPPRDAFTIAAWAMVPLVVQSAAGVAVVAWFLHGRTLSGDAATTAVLDRLVGIVEGPAFFTVAALVVCWQGYIIYQGLAAGRGMDDDRAALTATIVATGLLALNLV